MTSVTPQHPTVNDSIRFDSIQLTHSQAHRTVGINPAHLWGRVPGLPTLHVKIVGVLVPTDLKLRGQLLDRVKNQRSNLCRHFPRFLVTSNDTAAPGYWPAGLCRYMLR
jgi:hypothetical protein